VSGAAFKLRMKIWGVRGSTPTPQLENMVYGGNTPCLEVRLPGGEIFLFDAGTGARKLGQALLKEADGKPLDISIFLTHFHWDHIQGIPFFEPLYDRRNRIRFLAHYRTGPLRQILEGQMTRPYFPVNFEAATRDRIFHELTDKPWREGELRVTPFALHHPQNATGYRIEVGGASIIYATDHEHGNADCDRGLRHIAQGADLLIFDSQFTPEEYATHRGWGHSTWAEALSVAKDAQVKKVMLFHHDPSHTDDQLEQILDQARQVQPEAVMAREGLVVEL